MAKERQKGRSTRKQRYDHVDVSSVSGHRRGKHHDVVAGILEELESLPDGSALKIPVATLDGVTVANIRSAVHRATRSKSWKIESAADPENFYVWKNEGK